MFGSSSKETKKKQPRDYKNTEGKFQKFPFLSQHAKDLWYLCQHNWWGQVILFMGNTIITGHQTCIICNGPLTYKGQKPSICEKLSCKFGYQEMGLGFSLTHEILNNKIMLDMFIAMLKSSCDLNRIELCYPEEVRDAKNHDETFMKDDKPNPSKLKQVIAKIPSLREMETILGNYR
eukprot:UN30008